jgi:lipopolysaccharide/colanic/teichoic acid biosynthesis glycosyltransferase
MSGQTLFENLRVQPEPIPLRRCEYAKRKRGLDILGSSILLLLFAPLYGLLALLVKVTSKGPVFYSQTRVGEGGKCFRFVKFRSMYIDADQRRAELQSSNEKGGPIFKMRNDPRITPIGRILRKFSLDELPQLVHVFTGHMSLVGPRPPLPKEVEQYSERQRQRLSVRPGITCYWQIMGRSDLTFDEWMELDLRYLQDMSVWTDLKILAKTPMAVVKGKGAY